MERNIVIVLNNDNYKANYAEEVPFKAIILSRSDMCVIVKSIITNKEYELYPEQILECLDIKKIIDLIDLTKY